MVASGGRVSAAAAENGPRRSAAFRSGGAWGFLTAGGAAAILGVATGASGAPAEVRAVVPRAGGRPGFTALAPGTTGILFTNRLTPAQAVQNQNLMNGSGVAAGDFDGDGRCDLFFCRIAGPNALYRNLGGWRFEDVTGKAGVAGEGWASSGATFADLDGDGDLDLLVSTLGAGPQCYRNTGAGRFERVTDEAGLTAASGSTSLVLGDVDGDGDLDLYVVNYGAESVLRSGGRAEVRRVNGQWEFTGPQAHRLRFVEGQVEEVGEVGFLYLNDGRGRFQPVPWNSESFIGIDGRPKAPPLDYGLGAQMRDVNGDGAPDLYICNDFQMPDRLWINDGRGRFREAPAAAVRKFPFSSMGVDFADLDRDGNLDFMVVEMASRQPTRSMRQVTGVRPSPNLPGRFDARPQVVRNTLFRSNGDGSWSEIAEYAGVPATDWSWQPVFLDVDLDGFEDLLIVNGMMFDTQDRDTLARVRAMGRQSPEAARGNLLLYPPFPSPNLAYRNLGAFAFREVSADWGFASTRISQGVALADLDDDGDADMVVNCLNDGALIYRNEASAPRLSVRLRGRAPNTRGIGARIEVEGGPVRQQQEILAGGRYLSGDDTFRTFACGAASRLTVQVTWRSGRVTTLSNAVPNAIVTVAEDGAAPATEAPPAPRMTPWFADATARLGLTHHEEVFDDFARQPLLHRQLSSLGPGVAWSDLDGDGTEELVIGTGRGGRLTGVRIGADGTPTPLASEWTAPDDVVGLSGWITRSGRPALVAAVASYEEVPNHVARLVEVTLEPGESRLRVADADGLPPLEPSVGPVAAADFDGDGDLDLFVGARVVPGAYPRAGASKLFRRDGGTFVSEPVAAPILEGAGMVSGAVWTDLEGDGFPELVLACEWGPLRILRNVRGRLEAWDPPVTLDSAPRAGPTGATGTPDSPEPVVRRLSELTGWWTAITAGDFNRDGRLDLVVANWGLNTGYRADAEHPLRLYFGDLGGAGHTDLVETWFAPDLGKYVPRRSLNSLGQALPFLAARFASHQAYATAGAEEVLAGLSAPPAMLSVSVLASLVLLNSPTGFVAHTLPAEAQFAPAFGMTVADADGDGNPDLFLAQNFYAMRMEWPRTDAGRGLWLQGDGTGRFRPLPARESGLALRGEQRGAALGDFNRDGRPDLVVAQNGAETALWQNAGTNLPLWVEVSGPPGNPQGFGVTVRGTEPGSAVHEIRAAGGYWSKDSAAIALAGAGRPGELLIRWPGGREERVKVPPTGNRLRLTSVAARTGP